MIFYHYLPSRYSDIPASLMTHVSVSSTTVNKREIWCLCALTFGQKGPKLNNSSVYCLQLLSILFKNLACKNIFSSWIENPNAVAEVCNSLLSRNPLVTLLISRFFLCACHHNTQHQSQGRRKA